jgi:hypothetical protein
MQSTIANVGSVIAAAIPALRLDIEEDEGLPHLMFMDLWRWTESSVQNGRLDEMTKAIQLVDEIYQDCDAKIKNAVTVAFLENIDPEDEVGGQVFDVLTPELRNQWKALDEYMHNLIGKSLRGIKGRSRKASE